RQTLQDPLDQRQALSHLVDAHPDSGIHIAIGARDDSEAEFAVGQWPLQLAGVKRAVGGAADEAAGAELPRQGRTEAAGRDRAILQRGGAIVELHQGWETRVNLAQ